MCELLGISSDRPAALAPLLLAFAERGGKRADNPDGWGLAYFTEDGMRLENAPEAAADSRRLRLLAHTVRSALVIGHIRKANPPTDLTPANTHPFVRECCGRRWVFAHNGVVATASNADGCCRLRRSQPFGDTDSERAFCFLLEEIAPVFMEDKHADSSWLQALARLSALVARHGRFNFLLSDGRLLIACGHDRLHALRENDGGHRRIVIATEPFTGGRWEKLPAGALRVFRAGEQLAGLD